MVIKVYRSELKKHIKQAIHSQFFRWKLLKKIEL